MQVSTSSGRMASVASGQTNYLDKDVVGNILQLANALNHAIVNSPTSWLSKKKCSISVVYESPDQSSGCTAYMENHRDVVWDESTEWMQEYVCERWTPFQREKCVDEQSCFCTYCLTPNDKYQYCNFDKN